MTASQPDRGRRTTYVALVLAAVGTWIGLDAWWSGSLMRYQLVGYFVAGILSLPLLSRLLLGRRVLTFWRRVAFSMVPLLISLLVGEVLMRCLAVERERPAKLLHDARLGHMVAPGTAGADDRGFRNPESVEHADVLLVGDSQTWGFAVPRDGTFCSLLGKAAGITTYQMANGSYGPVQYVELVRRGLALQPKLVVVGFYFGNDLVDARDYAGLEGAATVRTEGQDYVVRRNPDFDGASSPNLVMTMIDGVLGASVLLDSAAKVVKSRMQGGVLDEQLGAVAFEHPTAATILLPGYRLPAVDGARISINDGLRITARCLLEIAKLCSQQGAQCLLLLIPSKEYCYAQWPDQAVPELAILQVAEQAMHAELVTAAGAAGIPVIDATEALVAAMKRGEAPWFKTGDSHLNNVGHRVVARQLQSYWRD